MNRATDGVALAASPATTDDLAAALAASPAHPGFAEPWHAEVFAFTHALSRRGVFTWSTWADTFATVIAAHPQASGEAIEAAYFRQWLTALEALLARSGVCDSDVVGELATRWRTAYLNTPHGQAVELVNAGSSCARIEHKVERCRPVAIAPATTTRRAGSDNGR